MPYLSRKEFAELAGIDEKVLNVYVARKKVNTLPGDKKLIDPDDQLNIIFIQDRREAAQMKAAGLVTEKAPKSNSKVIKMNGAAAAPETVTNIPKKATKKPGLKPLNIKQVDSFSVPRGTNEALEAQLEQNRVTQHRIEQAHRLKQLEIEQKELAIQTERMRLDKTAGKLLPIDQVAAIIERNGISILKGFEKGFEQMAEIYCQMAGFNPTRRAAFIDECKTVMGKCITDAGELADNEIDILIDDYSETLMRGQKKA